MTGFYACQQIFVLKKTNKYFVYYEKYVEYYCCYNANLERFKILGTNY